MDFAVASAVVLAVILALNVGGNNSAAVMGPAFGAGVRSKGEAVVLIACFSLLGALIAGKNVVATVGKGLLSGNPLDQNLGAVVIILLSATAIIALANGLRVPLATSHAMVGSVVGMGVYSGCVEWDRVRTIVAWWLVTPALSLALSYLAGRHLHPAVESWLNRLPNQDRLRAWNRGFVTLSGCYMAFSAGSNGLAKAVGPVVGAGILPSAMAMVIGGLSLAAGALVVGHRLLGPLGTEITPLCPMKAGMIALICGTITITASLAGIPVSLAHIVTCSVVGFSCAYQGARATARNQHVRVIYKLWPVCPLATGLATLGVCLLFRIAHTP